MHARLSKTCQPDLILRGRRIAVWVDGDFWHGCPIHGRKVPFTGVNATLWQRKFDRIHERDAAASAQALALGWSVVRVWECAILADTESAVTAVLEGRSPEPARRRP